MILSEHRHNVQPKIAKMEFSDEENDKYIVKNRNIAQNCHVVVENIIHSKFCWCHARL